MRQGGGGDGGMKAGMHGEGEGWQSDPARGMTESHKSKKEITAKEEE